MIETPYGRKTPELLTAAMDTYTAIPEILEELEAVATTLRPGKARHKIQAITNRIKALTRQP